MNCVWVWQKKKANVTSCGLRLQVGELGLCVWLCICAYIFNSTWRRLSFSFFFLFTYLDGWFYGPIEVFVNDRSKLVLPEVTNNSDSCEGSIGQATCWFHQVFTCTGHQHEKLWIPICNLKWQVRLIPSTWVKTYLEKSIFEINWWWMREKYNSSALKMGIFQIFLRTFHLY